MSIAYRLDDRLFDIPSTRSPIEVIHPSALRTPTRTLDNIVFR